jgi:hypothetical protein
MDINKTFKFIQNIYDTYNISHSLIVYDKDTCPFQFIEQLHNLLKVNDYPVYVLEDFPINIVEYEHKYRMFILEKNTFHEFVKIKDNDISNISVIFCFSPFILQEINKTMTDINDGKSVHLFSC